MVLNLSLSPSLEERLRQEAARRGVTLDAVTLELLEKYLPHDAHDRRAAAIAMLREWSDEDATLSDAAAADNAAVLHALDEHRASYRKLFTNVLGGENDGSAGAA